MPTSAPKPCTVCAVLVHGGDGQCVKHKRVPWLLKRPDVKRTTGRKLQAQRAALFAANPWCAICLPKGMRVLAQIRDHKVPLAEGGSDEDSNIQGICKPCDKVKSAAETARGRGVQKSGAPQRETDPSVTFSRG